MKLSIQVLISAVALFLVLGGVFLSIPMFKAFATGVLAVTILSYTIIWSFYEGR